MIISIGLLSIVMKIDNVVWKWIIIDNNNDIIGLLLQYNNITIVNKVNKSKQSSFPSLTDTKSFLLQEVGNPLFIV